MSASARKTNGGGGSYVDASGAIRTRAAPTFLQQLQALFSGLWTILVLFFRSIMDPDVGSVGIKDARRGGGSGGGDGGGGGRGGGGGGGSGKRYGTLRNTRGSTCFASWPLAGRQIQRERSTDAV